MTPRHHLLKLAITLAISAAAAIVAVPALLFADGIPRRDASTDDTAVIVNSITCFADDHPEWWVHRAGYRDAATTLFKHSTHLAPPGAGRNAAFDGHLQTLAENPDSHIASTPDGQISLTCASCHRLDADGRYFQPIRFDFHCAGCHQKKDLGRFFSKDEYPEVPHANLELLNERFRLAVAIRAAAKGAVATTQPSDASGTANPPATKNASKGRSRGGSSSTSADSLGDARKAIANDLLQSRCGKCHFSGETNMYLSPGPDGPFVVKSPEIPTRWLPKSVFSHARHAMLDCVSCHSGAAASAKTSDVLIPKIATCRECHGGTSAAGDSSQPADASLNRSVSSARSDCVLCHIYHGRDHLDSTNAGQSLRDLIPSTGAGATGTTDSSRN